VLLRKKEQKAEVKTGGGGLPTAKSPKDPKQDRSGQLRNSTPGCERDAVWTSRGVASATDSSEDLIEGRSHNELLLNRLVVGGEEGMSGGD
jgi:hypothetical protein